MPPLKHGLDILRGKDAECARLGKGKNVGFCEILLSLEKKEEDFEILAKKYNAKIILDEIQNFGPAAGFYKGLSKAKIEFSMIFSVDLPFIDFKIFDKIELSLKKSAIIPVTNEKKHYLAGIYNKNLASVFKNAIDNNTRKIGEILSKIDAEMERRVKIKSAFESFFQKLN